MAEGVKLPVTAKLSDRILSLPLYPEMTERAVREVCRAIRDFAPR
jgi:dTDP-4-amino-4,6-dideoxygalactose transaminase